MTLQQYFASKPRGAQVALARAVGVSKTWMNLIASGRGLPSAEVCLMIEKYTKGAVLRKTLRPDLFGEIK